MPRPPAYTGPVDSTARHLRLLTETIAAVKAEIVRIERALDESRGENLELAEKLTALRSQLADQDADIADTTGFLP